MNEFIAVFGQRYTGLIDNAGVYNTYRVPQPKAPYPQDYIIDQQGYVRYWSDEYDPQEIMRIIDELLLVGTNETKPEANPEVRMTISPNPCRNTATIRIEQKAENGKLKIYNTDGQLIRSFTHASATRFGRPHAFSWDCQDQDERPVPAGVYFILFQAGSSSIVKPITVVR